MAIGDRYATAAEYRAQRNTQSDSDDAIIERALDAATRLIDTANARPMGFQKDTTAVERIYVPRQGGYPQYGWAEAENPWKASGAARVLDVDDLVSITTLTVDEDRDNTFGLTLTTSDYELLPRNAATRPVPEPYRQIVLTEWGSQWAWPTGARVKVNGVFGWPAVPAAIKAACIELAALILMQSPRATSRANEMGATILQTSKQAQSIIADLVAVYRHPAVYV